MDKAGIVLIDWALLPPIEDRRQCSTVGNNTREVPLNDILRRSIPPNQRHLSSVHSWHLPATTHLHLPYTTTLSTVFSTRIWLYTHKSNGRQLKHLGLIIAEWLVWDIFRPHWQGVRLVYSGCCTMHNGYMYMVVDQWMLRALMDTITEQHTIT